MIGLRKTRASRDALPFYRRSPSKYMTLTYVGSLLAIACLSLIVHSVLDRVIEQGSQTGLIVNLSGQQRMLSQRATMFTLEYLNSGSSSAKAFAQRASQKMRANHESLLEFHRRRGREMSEAMSAMYFDEPLNIDLQVRTFIDEIDRMLHREGDVNSKPYTLSDFMFSRMAKQELLEGLDAVVRQYEDESTARVHELRQVQRIVLIIIILTILVEALFIFRPMVAKVSDLAGRLQYEANFDALSGLLNRRAHDLLADRVFKLAKRHHQNLSVAIGDIDFFKNVNDNFGHSEGDRVIALAATILRENCRETDVIARIGGEEFSIILPNTPMADAKVVAEKLRQAFAASSEKRTHAPADLTMSFGISGMHAGDDAMETILARADRALYAAKAAGRNCVKVKDPAESASPSGEQAITVV